jgi:hypothetical protein
LYLSSSWTIIALLAVLHSNGDSLEAMILNY